MNFIDATQYGSVSPGFFCLIKRLVGDPDQARQTLILLIVDLGDAATDGDGMSLVLMVELVALHFLPHPLCNDTGSRPICFREKPNRIGWRQ